MKLLEKLKTMIYEEDEDEEEEIAKKIDVEKTIKEEYKEVEKEKPVEEVKTPIIFDVEDFIEEEKPVFKEQTYNTTPPKKKKVLYGGYDNNYKYSNYKEPEVKKEKFDVITFRAFRPLDDKMTKTLLGITKKDGTLAAYKAKMDSIKTEMEDIKKIVPDYEVVNLTVPGLSDSERNLVIIHN